MCAHANAELMAFKHSELLSAQLLLVSHAHQRVQMCAKEAPSCYLLLYAQALNGSRHSWIGCAV